MTKSDELTQLRARLAEAEAELEAWRKYDLPDADTLHMPARKLREKLGLRNLGTAKLALALYEYPRPVSLPTLGELVPPMNEGRHDVNYFSAEVCYLRRSIGFDAVTTHWGWGYELTPKGRDIIRKALSETE